MKRLEMKIILTLLLCCTLQLTYQEECEEIPKDKNAITEHTFETDNRSQLKVLLVGGENGSVILICTVNCGNSTSVLYRSTNGGDSFANLTNVLRSYAVFSAMTSPTDDQKVVLILNNTENTLNQTIWMSSNDSAATFFGPIALPFLLKQAVLFHSSNSNYLLALGIKGNNCNAYISVDFGNEWTLLHPNVVNALWSPTELETIYLLIEVGIPQPHAIPTYELISRTVSDKSVKVVMKNVASFFAFYKFLYVAIKENKSSNVTTLKVSTSCGNVWNEVQFLPDKKGQNYRFLDATSGTIFLYVGSETNGKETGSGVIYTSDRDGILFSESLTNADIVHGRDCKFHIVESMQGVYFSQQNNNGSQSMITFNRGKSWQKMNFSEECMKSKNSCRTLKITYDSVDDMSINPLSVNSKLNLPIIIVHVQAPGTVVSDKKNVVYISLDGGSTWNLTLSKPHFVSVANQGALLVAAPIVSGITNFKYSADQGRTWACVKLKKLMVVTNLLTQPKSWTTKVIVVSRNQEKTEWTLTAVNFGSLVGKHCTNKDFDTFLGHGSYSSNSSSQGCTLGVKELFRKMKNSSRCLLKESLLKLEENTTFCPCSRDDYECDFGFYVNGKGTECVENPKLRGKFVDLCSSGETHFVKTSRYRKIPGNMCIKGWDPALQFGTVERQNCLSNNLEKFSADSQKMKNVVIAVIVMLVVVIVFTMVVYFIRKLQQLSKQEPTYRYSKLNQDETVRGIVSDEDSQETLVDISSEEDESSPATLLVHSHTVSPVSNGSALNSVTAFKTKQLPEASIRSFLEDDDDELLQ